MKRDVRDVTNKTNTGAYIYTRHANTKKHIEVIKFFPYSLFFHTDLIYRG